MRLRAAGLADEAAVTRVVRRAFGAGEVDHPEADRVAGLVAALRAAGDVRGELVAEAEAETEGAVVGHVMVSRGWLDARERLVEVGVLSPLSVDPDHQGHGVGSALLTAARDLAERLALPVLALEGSPAFYGARGFVPGRDLGLGRPSERIPEPAFQAVLLSDHEPWMTGRLVYPDTFWRTDCVGLRDPDLAEVESALG